MSRRVELGLDGGGMLLLTVEDADVKGLTGAYAGDRGVHAITTDEGEHVVDLAKVTYVRVHPGEANTRLGFGGA